ncbi:Uncharacterised protein [Bordetella pertussis]|nr:Uncharacterised protein [Bordetella pertussis]CFO68185.1 Uncharacterised protein [Bordetella pertussis]CFU81105.1 Uncharacterised protein [Bordetella pertussis]CPH89170.1 Uncharacterised protein [Bordetella pertussis]CPL05561.1 Uncharacterised protein [Bordetella pertussis]
MSEVETPLNFGVYGRNAVKSSPPFVNLSS